MSSWLHAGDILMTSEAPLGSTVLLRQDVHACIGQRLFALRPNQNIVLPEYLYAWLSSPAGQSALGERASGTTVKGIRQTELVKIVLPVPDLHMQREFLNTWSVLKLAGAMIDIRIQASRTLRESSMRDVFGGS